MIVNALLLCIANLRLDVREVRTEISIANVNGSIVVTTPGHDNSPLVSDQIVYICLYAAILLSFIPGAFAWLMHGDMLDFIWTKLGTAQRSEVTEKAAEPALAVPYIHAAQMNGSIFWLVSFICPAVLFTLVGLSVLVWKEHGYVVATPFSVGFFYCLFQLYRVLRNIARGCCGPSKGQEMRDLEGGHT